MQRLWITGYRSYELNTFGDKDPKIIVIKYAIKNYIMSILENGDLDWIITGPNLGVEQWSAQVALELRKDYPIRVSIMTPYMDFGNRWGENNKEKLISLSEEVDFYASTSKNSYQSPAQLRGYQNFMITHTDRAFMIYDPEYPGKPKYDYDLIKKYQEKNQRDYPFDILDFYDLQEIAEEYQEYQENHQVK